MLWIILCAILDALKTWESVMYLNVSLFLTFCLFRMACMNIDTLVIQRSKCGVAFSVSESFQMLDCLCTASENLYWFSIFYFLNFYFKKYIYQHSHNFCTYSYNSFLMEFLCWTMCLLKANLRAATIRRFYKEHPEIPYRFFLVCSMKLISSMLKHKSKNTSFIFREPSLNKKSSFKIKLELIIAKPKWNLVILARKSLK